LITPINKKSFHEESIAIKGAGEVSVAAFNQNQFISALRARFNSFLFRVGGLDVRFPVKRPEIELDRVDVAF
jgi:hypothetical protein